MNRTEAFALLKQYVEKENMIKHSLASEAVMRALAKRLGQDAELWGICGLLHDIECEAIGIPLNEFAQLSLEAMQGISNELGL